MEDFLKEAVDTTFLNNSMFQNFGKNSHKDEESNGKCAQKSERYLPEADEIDKELIVTESMKKFMSRKLSDLVAKKTCFVDEVSNAPGTSDLDLSGIRLLKDSQEFIKETSNPREEEISIKKPQRKKRKRTDEPSEEEKIQQSSVSPDLILSQSDIKHWTPKRRGKVYHYQKKNHKLYLQEPENEFSNLRRKNNWDESKICKYRTTF
ncbi:uncharacterized protein LOC132258876 [Phlebotomus argentipes]|uniref:uncharacterized protein LOC132258876 n=1 Tax=Phlebotomus argentipes TaxID=94469 RepID=UPI002892CC95|nr:uncharacterized protein LOC132258876 [Phlebotomus argentipes]